MLDAEKNEGLGTRLTRAMEEAGVSVEDLAAATGVSVQAVYGWRKTGEVHRDHLPTIAERVKRSIDWLLTGREFSNLYVTPPGPTTFVASDAVVPDESAFAMIPRFAVQVSGGGGATQDVEPIAEPIAFRRSWLKHEGLALGSLAVLEARGESMSPRIQPGDILLIDRHDTTVTDGKVYVVENHGLRVKRLFRRYDGQIIVRSDNPMFPEETAPADVLRVVGRVTWIGGRI